MGGTAEIECGAQPQPWLQALVERLPARERDLVARALDWAAAAYAGRIHPCGESWLDHARGTASALGVLRMDGEALAAALLLGAELADPATREALARRLGQPVVVLVQGVHSMAPIQALRGRADALARSADKSAQLEALRKMLLAMVQDIRVVLIKLADQVQTLRYVAVHADAYQRAQAAQDTFELLAPLANRLGVWQLKWELEDLAFRCQEPETYKSIARGLDEKRADREAYITRVIRVLREQLAAGGIAAEVSGRPKHIFSIYKKMMRKGVALDQLSDVRAVRVLVDDVKDCYTALGIVHNLWSPVPGEFDDYIAKPKANDYRSLHTAVVGPEDKILEVQIRTHEMHQHAELGVAAHWRYKESAGVDARFDRRLSWLRRILDWREELSDAGELAESFKTELFEDSVYVLTPAGRVIDLPKGATPIDFAYHVHTELGHRCRGAKVNGQMVPLHYQLSNGEVVEIVAAKEGGPSRDWLNPELGFIRSGRARAKVRQWFNSREHAQALAAGRIALEKELARLGRIHTGLEELAAALKFGSVEELFLAQSRGEISARSLQNALKSPGAAVAPAAQVMPLAGLPARQPASGILLVGVDKLLTQLARCCKPAPPDPIIGFVTRGRGVTVHRVACSNVAQLPAERLIAAQWGRRDSSTRFAVDVEVLGSGHPNLMRDVLDIMSREKVRVLSSNSQVRDLSARLLLTLEVEGVTQLELLLKQIRALPGVSGAQRR
jgi:GTP pyrophosphokinase